MRHVLRPYLLMALFGLLICCTRTSEVRTQEKLAVQEEVKGRERDRSTEVVQSGPETITTTTEEYVCGPTECGSAIAGTAAPAASAPKTAGGTTRSAPAAGAPILLKRTVTVDQRGPVVATKTEVATKVESASLTEKQEKASDTKKKTSYWPPIWMWACGAALLGLGGWALKRGIKIASL